jgi:hypothetical protein
MADNEEDHLRPVCGLPVPLQVGSRDKCAEGHRTGINLVLLERDTARSLVPEDSGDGVVDQRSNHLSTAARTWPGLGAAARRKRRTPTEDDHLTVFRGRVHPEQGSGHQRPRAHRPSHAGKCLHLEPPKPD